MDNRLDAAVWPEKFKCATVNRSERDQLKTVKNIVRLGTDTETDPFKS